MGPSLWHILLVVGIFVILFMGPSRLPGVGKSIGEAIRGFKKGLNDDEIDVTDSANDPNMRISGSTKKKTTRSASARNGGTPRKKRVKQPIADDGAGDEEA